MSADSFQPPPSTNAPARRSTDSPCDLSIAGLAPQASPSPAVPLVVVSREQLQALSFAHGHTEIFPHHPGVDAAIVGAQRHGITTWIATRAASTGVWLSWQWAQLESSVVMLLNPLNLRSNMEVIDTQDKRLNAIESMIHFNRVIHRLDWHRVIQRANGTRSA
ncbi:MAG TPA: DUF4902 domain-containing protein [Albitalea sp.]|nr:DUF4902 domain-containing protein [Albitalea sp.]